MPTWPDVARPAAVDPIAAPAVDSSVAIDHRKRILLVDEQAHVLRVMRPSLDRNGYQVDTARDGEVALRMLRERRYAALITCSELAPGGQGLCASVYHRLGETAPLMLVMADEDGDDPCWAMRPPGVEPIARPVSLRWIVARLNEHFGEHELR